MLEKKPLFEPNFSSAPEFFLNINSFMVLPSQYIYLTKFLEIGQIADVLHMVSLKSRSPKAKNLRKFYFLLLVVCCLTGCATQTQRSSLPEEKGPTVLKMLGNSRTSAGYSNTDLKNEADFAAVSMSPKMAQISDETPVPAEGMDGYSTGNSSPTPILDTQNSTSPTRMVEYTANLSLRSASPMGLLDSAEALVKEFPAYVESRQHQYMLIRVQRNSFEPLLKKLGFLGELISQSVSANDITNAYTEVKLRMELLEKTRLRYQALLLKTQDEKTQLDLLQEIKRLTEVIESQTAQLQQLSQRAEYSTIHLNIEAKTPRFSSFQLPQYSGFEWIHELDPLTPQRKYSGKYFAPKIPQDFIQLPHQKKKKIFEAVSAEGVRILAKILPNRPQGDSAFWLSTIQHILGPTYQNHQIKQLADFSFVRLQSHSDTPYLYYVGVKVCGKKLKIIEIYFPNSSLEEKFQTHFSSFTKKGGSTW